jgi:hypothetical protein
MDYKSWITYAINNNLILSFHQLQSLALENTDHKKLTLQLFPIDFVQYMVQEDKCLSENKTYDPKHSRFLGFMRTIVCELPLQWNQKSSYLHLVWQERFFNVEIKSNWNGDNFIESGVHWFPPNKYLDGGGSGDASTRFITLENFQNMPKFYFQSD